MKHLKNFLDKTFHRKPKLPEEVRLNIIDICLELEDVGFRIFKNQLGFNKLGEREGFYLNIIIDAYIHVDAGFKYSEISEVVERLKNYMLSVGYETIVDKTSKHVKIKYEYDPSAFKKSITDQLNGLPYDEILVAVTISFKPM